MADKTEASSGQAYRDARKAFVAHCTRAHADSIVRVHPDALGPDGKPLFIDSAAFGSRAAKKALLVITGCDGRDGLLGSRFLNALLEGQVIPRVGTRLVLIHALNPSGVAWHRPENEDGLSLDDSKASASWSFDMLRAIATEDLAKVENLRLLEVAGGSNTVEDGSAYGPARVLRAFRPQMPLRAARLHLRLSLAVAAAKPIVTGALATL